MKPCIYLLMRSTGSLSAPLVCAVDEDDLSTVTIARRLTALEQDNTKLRESNERLEAMMRTTMEAVLGVCHIINNIYFFHKFLTGFTRRITLQLTRSETESLTWVGINSPLSDLEEILQLMLRHRGFLVSVICV